MEADRLRAGAPAMRVEADWLRVILYRRYLVTHKTDGGGIKVMRKMTQWLGRNKKIFNGRCGI